VPRVNKYVIIGKYKSCSKVTDSVLIIIGYNRIIQFEFFFSIIHPFGCSYIFQNIKLILTSTKQHYDNLVHSIELLTWNNAKCSDVLQAFNEAHGWAEKPRPIHETNKWH